MKLGIYQTASPAGDVDGAFATIEQALKQAATADVEMLVCPELFLPGYNQFATHHRLAQSIGGPWEQELGRLAKRAGCGLTIGWAEVAGAEVFNSASTFDAMGRKLAHYRKIQLFGPLENANFTAGSTYTIFDLKGYKTALLICYDIEFAQHSWNLAQQGVDLILIPTANPEPFGHVSDILVPARAVENDMTIAYANYCADEAEIRYSGRSVIVGPDARPLAKAGLDTALLIADLADINKIEPAMLSTQHHDFRKIGDAP